ncbi:subtilase-type protease inhibitor [Streptomyces sp. NPDC048639]|uniref:subtilase-type protease inhibitor n=1 Tax=Streptomyces sp. NPDC048639 TaxID=3365581 RepID=UPI003710686A
MRYTVRALGAVSALTVGLLAGTTGAAQAAPAEANSLYAPSAMVLTVGKGNDAATSTVQRAVLLNCFPKAGGTHPAAAAACAELRSVGGEFASLTVHEGPGPMCTKIWDPVVVTADGVWQGKRVSWSQTFANSCEMNGAMQEGSVYSF